MKKTILFLLVLSLCVNIANAQRAKIITEFVTPYMQSHTSEFAQDSTIATGLRTVPNNTWCYVNVENISGTAAITGATWTILSKPAGSNASIIPINTIHWWAKLRPDVKGAYVIKVTMNTSAGSHDTTTTIYSATFVGTGNYDNVPAIYPNCMTCHAGFPQSIDIFNRWKTTRHAVSFSSYIDSGSAGFGLNCFPCHTTGYNHNLRVNDHGFDDIADSLGWVWAQHSPPHPGNWDTLKTMYSPLVAYASVGCESCHGPGSEHVVSGDTSKIQITYNAGLCGTCHDSPEHHVHFTQWQASPHSDVVWSSSFAQNSGAPGFDFNGLGNCIRCHDGRGFVNFTKGVGTNTVGMIQASQEEISCQACHDPHGSPNEHQLRSPLAGSDTLANGYHYTIGGNGRVCMNCHKNRTNADVTVLTRVTNSHWGPHHSVQSDILLGQNAAKFNNVPYLSGSHKNIENLCVHCHMAPTADTGNPAHNKVGEHTFRMVDEASGYENVSGCQSCHPGVTSFNDFMAPQDYDGNSQIESWQIEMAGCIRNMRIALPPSGIDSVSWELVAADTFNVNLKKAYWNYLLLSNDGSLGLHNPFFYVSVYYATMGIIGVEPISGQVPKVYSLSQNYPNPFNPTTKIKFSLPKQENVSIKIYDIMGREVYTLVNKKMTAGNYEATWTAINNDGKSVASGVYFYRIEAGSFVESKKMILVR